MKFRIEVKLVDYKQILNNNLDSLGGYPGGDPTVNLADLDLLDFSDEIKSLADSFVHDDFMIIELDTENKTATVIPSTEAHSTDYLIGIVS